MARQLNPKTTLLLVHGFGADRTSWQPLQEILGQEVSTRALDGWGFGEDETPGVEGWCFDSVVDSLAQEVRRAGGGTVAIGSSLGATAVLALAARGQADLAGVIAIGGSPYWLVDEGWPYGYDPKTLASFLDGLRRDWVGTMAAAVPSFALTDDEQAIPTKARATRALDAAAKRTRDPKLAIRAAERTKAVDIRAALKQIGVPVLLIHGDRDPIAPPSLGRWMSERIPDARCAVIPGVGHLPHMTSTPAVGKLVQRFYRAL